MNSRRLFIKDLSTTLAGAPLIHSLAPYLREKITKTQLEIYATNWGFEGAVHEFCAKAKEAGYAGIEVWTPQGIEKTDELIKAVEAFDLKLGLLAGNWGATYQDNLQTYKRSIDHALTLSPRFINCHAGKDFYPHMYNDNFLEYSYQKSSSSNIPIYHETHRGRMLYSAPVAEQYVEQFQQLKLTLDISHWCCVHESLLADQKERIDLLLSRVEHIHARVGFAEAPQIPDPRDPQFDGAVQAHFAWWDAIVDDKAKKGEVITMTTEFGPPSYMWTHLGSRKPLADNWEVNVAMKQLWEERYLNDE